MDFRHLLVFVIVAVEQILCLDPLCDKELIKGLPDNLLSASSSLSDPTLMTDPTRARLNTVENTLNNGTTYMGAWAPTVDGGGQYIQATFPELTMVTGIQTQGRNQGTDHVTLYKIEYTLDGKNWETVNNDIGVEQIFMGNTDGDTIQDNPLDCPLFAKGIRIVPLEWDRTTALRFEVNGCYLDNSIVVTTPSAASSMTTVAAANSSSSFLPGIQTPFGPTTPAAATIITTPTQSLVTTNPKTTVNLLTLIHWFMTHISNTTTPASTTPITTTIRTTLPSSTITTTTTTTTTTTPPTAIKTTTPYVFMPGIQNPFGPSTRAFKPGILIG